MGKILQIINGFDNKIRTVKLKQSNGKIEYHSICNLYPLELSQNHIASGNDDSETEPEIQPVQTSRPKRKAPEKFRKMIRDNIEHL